MRKLIVPLFVISIAFSCKSFYFNRNINFPLESGYYIGTNKKSTIVFAEVRSDIIYADVILNEKFPRELNSDTLSINHKKTKYYGKFLIVEIEKGKLVIRSKLEDQFFGVDETIVLKPDETYFRKKNNVYKNYAVINMLYVKILNDYSSIEISKLRDTFNSLSQKIIAGQKVNSLTHSEFLIEFEKFENELMKELELLKSMN